MKNTAIIDVLIERTKQLKKWTPGHDDEHKDGELADAAAHLAGLRTTVLDAPEWAIDLRARHTRRESLVIAAALILAEIERLDRAEEVKDGEENGWTRATCEVEVGDIFIDPTDWIWRDPEGRIRRTYGYSGGSFQRAHTFDEQGKCVIGVEASDEDLPESDLDDPRGVHPLWRAIVEGYPCERGHLAAKELQRGG